MSCSHTEMIALEDRWRLCVCGRMFREMTPEATKALHDYHQEQLKTAVGSAREYLLSIMEALR
jgi:hypothetical protein